MHLLLRLGIVAMCLCASVLASSVAAGPASLHRVREGPPGASVPWEGGDVAVAFLEPLAYNATRDATLAGALVCSHRPCGPLVWVKGDQRELRNGPFLLVPSSTTFTFEDLAPPAPEPRANGTANASQPVPTTPTAWRYDRPTPYDSVHVAIVEPFEVKAAAPRSFLVAALVLAPIALVGLAPAGLSPAQRALYLLPVLAGAWLGNGAAGAGWGALGYLAILGPALLGSLVFLVGLAIWRKRVDPIALAVLALSFAFFVAMDVLTPYRPFHGWGD